MAKWCTIVESLGLLAIIEQIVWVKESVQRWIHLDGPVRFNSDCRRSCTRADYMPCVPPRYFAAYFNDLYRFDPAAIEWTALSPSGSAPIPRRYSAFAAAHDGNLYVFGGQSCSNEGDCHDCPVQCVRLGLLMRATGPLGRRLHVLALRIRVQESVSLRGS